MKRLLVIIMITVALMLALTSCSTVYEVIGLHTVTFDVNDGVLGTDVAESVNVFDGKTVKNLPVPTRENYTFDGWFSGDELFTSDTAVTSNMTLTAKWHPNKVTVKFLDQFGNLIISETIDYGNSATAPSVDAIVGNQKFVGWDKEFGSVTEDISVSAIYSDNVYAITYNCGGIAEDFSANIFMGELPTVPATPTADGYVFFGWYTDEARTDRYFFDYKLDTDTTLYAKFYDTSLGEYIVISNFDQLSAIKDDPDAKYLLACDINCKGENLTPIGQFSGEIEGNGYKIFNFTLDEDTYNLGFVATNKGTIKNLSFANFIYDVYLYNNSNSTRYYGVICGINNGTVDNCHTLDGELIINYKTSSESSFNVYCGGLIGLNNGVIINSTNDAILNVAVSANGDTYWGAQRHSYITSSIGGICGYTAANSSIYRCFNYAEIKAHIESGNGNGHSNAYVGGIVALVAEGSVKQSASTANISMTVIDLGAVALQVGGAIGQNSNGKIENCYVQCYVNIDNPTGNDGNDRIGGFIGYNTGKIYGSYSAVNIKCNTPSVNRIGGFVGYHELVQNHDSYINKCFAIGSIELGGDPVNVGCFVGLATANTKDAFYADSLTINKKVSVEDENGEVTETIEKIELTNDLGVAKAESELLTLNFIENTLYFDREIWFVYDGELPALR